ncbi:ClpP/crotonase-like domain-containing protein [Aspergillus varians]
MAQPQITDSNYPEFRNWFAERSQYKAVLDAEARHLILESIIQAVQRFFLDPAAGANLTDAFRKNVYTGAYDMITDGNSLAKAITSDLQSFSGDKHFRCLFGIPPDEPSAKDQVARLQKLHYGFGKVEVLPENIATIEIRGFVPVHWEGVRQKVDEIMSSIAGADALILDLRANQGGDPKTVALVASYLLGNEPMVWLKIVQPSNGLVEDVLTTPPDDQKRFGINKPIFIVTSSETISGGEDLTYGFQALRRAKVIGEKTAGAANLPRACPLNGTFVLFVPHRYPVHPITGSNWEGSGVIPEVEAAAVDGLDRACNLATETLGLHQRSTSKATG